MTVGSWQRARLARSTLGMAGIRGNFQIKKSRLRTTGVDPRQTSATWRQCEAIMMRTTAQNHRVGRHWCRPTVQARRHVSFRVQTELTLIFTRGVYISTSGGHHVCDGGDACATSTHAPDGNGDRPSGKLPNAGASRSDGSIPAHSGSHAPGPLAPQLP